MSKRVLLVGLQSSSADFSKWPGLTKEKLEQSLAAVEAQLRDDGFEAAWCLTDDGATAETVLEKALVDFQPDIVSIGAGVRVDPDLLLLFEAFVNIAHRVSPDARFAFGTSPMDTIAAVHRAAGP